MKGSYQQFQEIILIRVELGKTDSVPRLSQQAGGFFSPNRPGWPYSAPAAAWANLSLRAHDHY